MAIGRYKPSLQEARDYVRAIIRGAREFDAAAKRGVLGVIDVDRPGFERAWREYREAQERTASRDGVKTSAMGSPLKTRVIFENSHYQACALPDGSLVVTGKRRKDGQARGIHLVGPTAKDWIQSIECALQFDASEASALCRALMPCPSIKIRR
jgi:hypothetical protein